MDNKIRLQDFITSDLGALDFYDYLEEYATDKTMQFNFNDEEQEIINEAWSRIKQENTWNINVSKVGDSQTYKDYLEK